MSCRIMPECNAHPKAPGFLMRKLARAQVALWVMSHRVGQDDLDGATVVGVGDNVGCASPPLQRLRSRRVPLPCHTMQSGRSNCLVAVT